jgi:glycosyltransferase involved in cell wall biosynthesis
VKIWILEIGEPLPVEPGVRLHRYGLFSKYLASQGHSVTWWTSSFSHAPKKNFVDRDCVVEKDGVHLRFIFSRGYKKNISLARIKHQAEFGRRFLVQAQSVLDSGERPDVILAPIPTVDGAEAAVSFARKNRIPVIADIRDLWPDEIRDLAPRFARPMAELALFNAYRKLRHVCSSATAICGVSQSYLDYGIKFSGRFETENDFVFPLGYSVQNISDEDALEAETWFASLKIPSGAFVSCFFGTIGKFFDLSTVIEVARELGEDYYFVLGGDGSALEDFKKQASGLKNVIFTGWLDAAQIHAVMRHSNIGLAPYARHAKMSLPNKPFEYMSAGLCLVSSIQYELKDILDQNHAGFTYHADSQKELREILKHIRALPALEKEMGENARKLFEREFSSEKVFAKAEKQILKVAGAAR